ncbi:NlpC/P60 family peptidoglycan endopeptidase RipA [Mycolicibacterium mengxianglii]|uniref:NlpC/P60 family peptidoglycan endopeptidase RipA n=1 Tax=Mycolicibacterium mengxianglii TaxID=2736649 RepID=UPI0018EF0D09|nr:NlpC/P60 family peptidoglycan endopeptidase RipA [Mycolicibacterium mengxianglii]
MRPIHGASPLLTLALLLSTPGLALAEPPAPSSLAALIADVADANQQLQDLGAAVQSQQEGVNKAIVEVQTARDNVTAAQRELDLSQQAVHDADDAIAAAQHKFDEFAVASYLNGPSVSYLTAVDPGEILANAATEHTLALSSQKVMADLQRARTEQLNKESQARAAKLKADEAAGAAQSTQDQAVAALSTAQGQFADQRAEIQRLAAERDAAQAKLNEARAMAAPTPATAGTTPAARPQSAATGPAGPAADWDRAPAGAAAPPFGDTSQWDTTLPMVPSAFVSGDPIAIINAVLQISATSAQITADLGRGFLEKLGILKPADTGITNGAIPRVYGRQASEYVIKRAMSQMGVPYSWGGGNAAGPSRGIDSGAGTTGFDCSGLVLYAFAGVGIKLPHYSGSQYNMGRKIPSSQMRRGDVIFYGPGGSQHVTIYLGDGQMLEAPYTGSQVKISPVRTSGMTPSVVRYIEY